MTGFLALDTATDACSVALWRDGEVTQRHEVIPRQHSQRLFGMLRELLPSGDLRRQGIDALVFGAGPGSFTGLRIAASAVQGLAFASQLPVIPVSTLAAQASTALRQGHAKEGGQVFSAIDARINEIYCATYAIRDGLPVRLGETHACAPAAAQAEGDQALVGVGNGCRFVDDFHPALQAQLVSVHAQLLPEAQDLVPLALAAWRAGDVLGPEGAQPEYVREEVNWKKLPEQGRQP